MTFDQLDEDLPNGFHDAKLLRLALDYEQRSAMLYMKLLVQGPQGPNSEEYRGATVQVAGLCFCSIELPSPDEPFVPDGFPVNISGYSEESPALMNPNQSLAQIREILAKCPPGTSSYRFFSHDWNSFIHIAGTDVRLSWDDGIAGNLGTGGTFS